MELLLWLRELPEMQFSSFRGDRFFPHSVSHHHSFGPETQFLSKPQNIEDQVRLEDLFPWQLCSKPGTTRVQYQHHIIQQYNTLHCSQECVDTGDKTVEEC